LFVHYFDYQQEAAALFQQMRNNFRLDTLRCLVEAVEKDKEVREHISHYSYCYEICTDNRNALMHSMINDSPDSPPLLNLAKTARKDPMQQIYAQVSLQRLRDIADEIYYTEEFGTQLFHWVSRNHPIKIPDFPEPQLLPQKCARPNRLTLSPRANAQEPPLPL
jgi:hypothetical protein